MKVLRAGYVLIVIFSHMSNSLRGNHEQTKHIQDDLSCRVVQHAQVYDLLTLLNVVEQEFGGLCCVCVCVLRQLGSRG